MDFFTIVFKYGKFTMYCLLGPSKNILHLTFAPEKHLSAQYQLCTISPGISFAALKQEESQLHKIFRDYFSGKLFSFPLKIDSPYISGGTAFQRKVWHHISKIPYGKCITYRELAAEAGSPEGARAAGMACGANPMALIIPCHRVVAANGLGGFAGGTAVKKALLDLECNGSELSEHSAC